MAETLASCREKREPLFGYAHARFGFCRDEAQEILQETLMELMQIQRPIASPDGLVFRIFHLRCVRHLCWKKAQTGSPTVKAEHMTSAASHRRIHEHLLVRQGFARISRFCRNVLTSHYIDGNSMRETAEQIGRAYSGVSKLISRCLRRLKECLES
ncbi:MAG: sigma-70 family RNA polymerase sigma factor [Thermoanaerobaculia bacterium]|nr:sigma-70 family RNA polymerase sigma factor [Thermoanaerobaculia bacterium]